MKKWDVQRLNVRVPNENRMKNLKGKKFGNLPYVLEFFWIKTGKFFGSYWKVDISKKLLWASSPIFKGY